MADKRKALGRGLRALIPEPVAPLRREPAQEVDLDLLRPNREQPRGAIEDARLEELAASIRAHGIIQPLVVSRQEDGTFEIVAGERRWRAAQRAGLLRVPVVERAVANSKRLELALIENIQREDLNAIEAGAAYARLADEFGFTQEEIARSVGKDRATVANYQRLLRLPAEVRAEVASGALSMGHARALAGLADERVQRDIAREVLARDLSVRETEALVKRRSEPPRPPAEPPPPRRAHARGRRPPQGGVGNPRPHRPPGQARTDRDHVRLRGRAAAAVRAARGRLTARPFRPRSRQTRHRCQHSPRPGSAGEDGAGAGDGPAHAGSLEPVSDLLASRFDDARRDTQAPGAELRIAHPVAIPEHVVDALSRLGRGLDMDAQRGDHGAQPAGVEFGAPVPGPPLGQVGPRAVDGLAAASGGMV